MESARTGCLLFREQTNLRILRVADTAVADLSPLVACTQLEELSLGSTKVTRLDALTNLTKLHTLHLERLSLPDVRALLALPALRHVTVYRTYCNDGSLHELQELMKSRARPATEQSP